MGKKSFKTFEITHVQNMFQTHSNKWRFSFLNILFSSTLLVRMFCENVTQSEYISKQRKQRECENMNERQRLIL